MRCCKKLALVALLYNRYFPSFDQLVGLDPQVRTQQHCLLAGPVGPLLEDRCLAGGVIGKCDFAAVRRPDRRKSLPPPPKVKRVFTPRARSRIHKSD